MRTRNPAQMMYGGYSSYAVPPALARDHAKLVRRGLPFILVRNVAMIAALILVNKFLGATRGNILSFGFLMIHSLRGTKQSLQSLSLVALMVVSNPALISFGGLSGPLRMGALILPAIRILMDFLSQGPARGQHSAHIITLVIFCLMTAVLSFISNYFLLVSLLKLCSFGLVVFSLLAGLEIMSRKGESLLPWYLSVVLYILAMGTIAYLRGFGFGMDSIAGSEGRVFLFRGATNHSQTLGAVGALTFLFLFCLYQFSTFPYKWAQLVLMGVCVWQVYLTQARTGMGAIVVGCGILIWLVLVRVRQVVKIRFHMSKGKMLALLAALAIAVPIYDISSGGRISNRVKDFLLKGRGDTFEMKGVFSSRQGLMDRSLAIFRANPITGIGFGTSTDPYFINNASLFTAPTEKGFLPTAILEETGIVGTFFFVVFVISMYTVFLKEDNLPAVVGFSGILLVNLGEMAIFSMGGMGLVTWTMVAGCIQMGREARGWGGRRR